MPINGDILQLFNPEWLSRVTRSHGVHYRYSSAENQQYVLFLLLHFHQLSKNKENNTDFCWVERCYFVAEGKVVF